MSKYHVTFISWSVFIYCSYRAESVTDRFCNRNCAWITAVKMLIVISAKRLLVWGIRLQFRCGQIIIRLLVCVATYYLCVLCQFAKLMGIMFTIILLFAANVVLIIWNCCQQFRCYYLSGFSRWLVTLLHRQYIVEIILQHKQDK